MSPEAASAAPMGGLRAAASPSRPGVAMACVLASEVGTVLAVMRRNVRWAGVRYGGGNDGAADDEHLDHPHIAGLKSLRRRAASWGSSSFLDADPLLCLRPFLDVVRSDETGAAFSSLHKILSLDLASPGGQGVPEAMGAVVDAVTGCRFEVLQVRLACVRGRAAPALANRYVCAVVSSSFLDVVRSDETGAAFSSLHKILSLDLASPGGQGVPEAMGAVVDAVTGCRFEVLQVRLACVRGRAAPALANRYVCAVVSSSFLDVVRSDETGAAFSSLHKILSLDLASPGGQGVPEAMGAVVDAVTGCRFEVLQVRLACVRGRAAPALANRYVCAVVSSSFLDVVRSDETGAAFSSLHKILSLDLASPGGQGVPEAMGAVVDAVTGCRFEVLQVRLACVRGRAAPALANSYVCAVVSSSFRVVQQAGTKGELLQRVSRQGHPLHLWPPC